MRLTSMDPQWLERDGKRVGVMFRCPHCLTRYLTVFWVRMPIWGDWLEGPKRYAGQMGYIREALDRIIAAGGRERAVVPCDPDCQWQWNGQGFDSMTISPSLDASRSGDWHGFITNGAIA